MRGCNLETFEQARAPRMRMQALLTGCKVQRRLGALQKQQLPEASRSSRLWAALKEERLDHGADTFTALCEALTEGMTSDTVATAVLVANFSDGPASRWTSQADQPLRPKESAESLYRPSQSATCLQLRRAAGLEGLEDFVKQARSRFRS